MPKQAISHILQLQVSSKVWFLKAPYGKVMLLHTSVHVVPDSPQYTRTMHVTLSVLRTVCEFSCSVFFPRASERRVLLIVGVCSGGLFYIN